MPENAERDPVPAILEYIPYRKRDGTCARDALTHPYFAERNFACVRVDIRGNGESEGLMADEYTPQELSDGVAIIDWISKQPWCSGNVGIMGISWGGFNGLQIAALDPAALKAVITLCSTDDRYADDIHYKGGCLLNENLGWGATMLSYSSRPPDAALVGENWRETWLNRLDAEPFLPTVWLQHQTRDSYWKHGSICEDYAAIKVPVLAVGGWGDAYKNPVFRLLENLQSPAKAIVGPWVHKYPHFAVPRPQIGFLQEAVRWWNRWLRDEPNNAEDLPAYRGYLMDGVEPSTWYEARPGQWIAEEHWPSPHIENQELTLTDDGLRESGELTAPVEINTPLTVGEDGGEYCAIWLGPEWPGDQSEDDLRSQCFDGEILSADWDIVGAPSLFIEFYSNKPRAQIIVRLCDVAPDGKSHRVTYGVLNLCHRDSHETPAYLTPFEDYSAEIKLDDIAYRVPKGHKLRIALSTSYWPLIWPSPEAATLKISKGRLLLPIRDIGSGPDEVNFEPVESAPPWKTEQIRTPTNSRRLEVDQRTGRRNFFIIDDFGCVKDSKHGLITGSIAREHWSIMPDDPLSARGDLHWTQTHERNGVTLRTEARCSMWSDRNSFYLTGKVEAFENNEPVHEKNWDEELPRHYM